MIAYVTIQDFAGNDEPFGGKVLVMSGDFRQVLPVIPKASRPKIVASTIKHWIGWLNTYF